MAEAAVDHLEEAVEQAQVELAVPSQPVIMVYHNVLMDIIFLPNQCAHRLVALFV